MSKKRRTSRQVDWSLLNHTAQKQELFAKMPNGWFCYVWFDSFLGGYSWGYRRTRDSEMVVTSKALIPTAKLACEDFCLWYNTNGNVSRERTIEDLTRLEVERVKLPLVSTAKPKRRKRKYGTLRG